MGRLHSVFAALAVTAAALVTMVAPARADVVGIVRGTLTGPDHRPLSHVAVTLTGARASFTATTSDDGSFAFARVPFGRYTVRASTAFGNVAATVDVATGSVVDVPLLATATIGRSSASAYGVRGTPVAENAYSQRQISALPRNQKLDAIVETVPGIVRFSYDEPVAHGFHGITYEIDGAPLPQSTSSNFAQLIDPRDISAVEIFTGAYPAEFGGSRMGAVVNVQSALTGNYGNQGALTLGAGTQGTNEARLIQHLTAGKAQIGVAFNTGTTDRGLDSPAINAIHDASSTSNASLRVVYPFTRRDVLAADFSTQNAGFQIPINTNPNDPNSPIVAVPGTDDVQREDTRFASLAFTHTSKDGQGYVRVVPWTRYDRIQYLGDLANDVQAYAVNSDGSTSPQNGLRQDRIASYTGLRTSVFRAGTVHTMQAGLDLSQESLGSSTFVLCGAGNCLNNAQQITDNTAARGTLSGLYVEDKWSPNARLTVNAGLRYDHSTGYVSGSQLSPRFGVNQEIGNGTILHAYYGRMYAAPGLEDTRRDAVLTQTAADQAPVYDLQPERDSYVELGIARTFRPGLRGYINAFDRTAVNVLDTTNLLNTPLFAVFNNAVGRARGIEMRLVGNSRVVDTGVSFTYSQAVAGGVSGSTFLVSPGAASDITLQPEDHDQTYFGNAFYTRRFGRDLLTYATAQTEYGTGFPVAFQNGPGRLPTHWIANLALGRSATRGSGLGYEIDVENLFDHRYLIKVNNGFNTTQWNAPRRIVLRITAPW
jgi:outer membrane receptor protein involved in Fe transport